MIKLRDSAVENFFKKLGIKFKFDPELPYSRIHVDKGLKNNARIMTSSLVQDVALKYGCSMEDGEEFPAIVVSRNGRGFNVNGGNHRLEGFRLAGLADKPNATVAAYIIESDEEQILEIATRSLNRLNGLQQSSEEAIEHALSLREQFPSRSLAELSTVFKIKQDTLSRAERAKRIAAFLKERRINSDKLTRTALVELARLEDNEPVMAQTAAMAVDYSMTANEIGEIVSQVKGKRSESQKLHELEEIEERFRRRGTPKRERRSNPDMKFYGAINTLFAIIAKFPSLEHMGITSRGEREKAREDWEKLRGSLDKVFA
jgi:ParB-like chromosome segregation protein Spo0J